MNKRLKELISGLATTALVGAVFFIPYENMANIMFLLFLLGGLYGFLTILLLPIKDVTPKNFMWEFYVPQLIKIILLFNTPFPILGYLFSGTFIILLIKNLISMEQNVSHEIT